MGITLTIVNIVQIDNANPQVLSSLENAFGASTGQIGGFDGTWWAKFFMTLQRYAPIFIALVIGGVGWLMELTIFGNTNQQW
jgi:hypothetical protein